MNKTSIIENILKEQGKSLESCFFGNTTFLDLEPFRHKLKRNWRSPTLLSAVLTEIESNAINIYPDKRFSWVNLLRVAAEYSLEDLDVNDLYRLFKLSFIWSDVKLLQLTANAYRRLGLPMPFNAHSLVNNMLDEIHNQKGSVLAFHRLHADMLVDFYWQYACKELVKHCGLPYFKSNAQWYEWVSEFSEGETELDFVKHKDWGVIGGIYLRKVSDLGFLRFWIGRDFRNQGLAKHAVKAWIENKREQHQLPTLYSEVMQSNITGRQTLTATGFERVLIERTPPNDKLLFYRHGPKQSMQQEYNELQTLALLFADIHQLDKPMSEKQLQHLLQERLKQNLRTTDQKK